MDNIQKPKTLFPRLCEDFSKDALDVLINEYYGSENDLSFMELLLTFSNEFPNIGKALEYTGCKNLDELKQNHDVVEFVNSDRVLLIDDN